MHREQDVRVIEHPGLRDGLAERWPAELVARLVAEEVARRRAALLVTFDEAGVSGHANHADTFRGVRRYLREEAAAAIGGRSAAAATGGGGTTTSVRGFALVSTGIVRKYLGLFDAALSCVLSWRAGQLGSTCFALLDVPLVHRAMTAHASQYVWYRRLFVLFSRYGFVNTLRPIE